MPSRRAAAPENYATFSFVLDCGHFAFTQENRLRLHVAYGTTTVGGNRVEWRFTDDRGVAPTPPMNKPGEDFVVTWKLYKERMTLMTVDPPPDVRYLPWRRVSTQAVRSLAQHELPAAEGGAAMTKHDIDTSESSALTGVGISRRCLATELVSVVEERRPP